MHLFLRICAVTIACLLLALPAYSAPKLYGFGFSPSTSDKAYRSFRRMLPVCVKVSATKFKAASRYAAGKSKFPKSSSIAKKADRACTQIGTKVLLGSITVKTTSPAAKVPGPGTKATDSTSRCSIRVSSDGVRRVICEGMERAASATFDLPNGTTLIETAPPGEVLYDSSPRAKATCRYQFVSEAGLVSCLDGLQSITYLDTSALGANGSLPTFQSLSSGEVIFIGGSTEANAAERLFKLSKSGALTTLTQTDSNYQSFAKFLVESDDRIVLTGKTVDLVTGDVAPFIETISSAGEVASVISDSRTYGGQAISFLAKSPSGTALIGLTNVYNTVSDPGTAKIVAVNNDNSLINLIGESSSSPTYATDTFCSTPTTTRATFCNYGGTLITSAIAANDSMYIIGRSKELGGNLLPSSTGLFKILPDFEEVSLSSITHPLLIGGSGDEHIIVSGIDSSATYKIIAFNSETRSETLISSSLSAPLPFSYSRRNSMILGYGNAFPPTSLTVIQIPSATGTLGAPVMTEFLFSSGIPSSIRFAY